jgi:hypothetical protein
MKKLIIGIFVFCLVEKLAVWYMREMDLIWGLG